MLVGGVSLLLLSYGFSSMLHEYISSTPDTLTEKKVAESESQVFTKMPSPHYMEVAMLLLNK